MRCFEFGGTILATIATALVACAPPELGRPGQVRGALGGKDGAKTKDKSDDPSPDSDQERETRRTRRIRGDAARKPSQAQPQRPIPGRPEAGGPLKGYRSAEFGPRKHFQLGPNNRAEVFQGNSQTRNFPKNAKVPLNGDPLAQSFVKGYIYPERDPGARDINGTKSSNPLKTKKVKTETGGNLR